MKKNITIFISGILVAIFVAGIFGFFVARAAQKTAQMKTIDSQALADIATSQFVNLTAPKVLGDTTQKSSGVMASSENYQIKQISFGGGDISLANGNNDDNLQVENVHSELLMTKDQKDYRFLITWQTNKLAESSITYTKAGSSDKVLKENGYGFTHSVVLTDLEAGSAYSYVITTTDQWGNTVTSDKYAMYTSAVALSVFDLITKEFTGMFGWAMK